MTAGKYFAAIEDSYLATTTCSRPNQPQKQKKTRIEARGDEINQRQSFGHWEGDLLLFGRQYSHLITLRERQSRYVVAIKSENRKAQATANIS